MDTIASSADISVLFAQGKRSHTPYLTLIVLRNEKQHDPSGRVAFIAGKKLGCAVERNRIKRRLREAVTPLLPRMKPGLYVFIARQPAAQAEFSKLCRSMQYLLRKSHYNFLKYDSFLSATAIIKLPINRLSETIAGCQTTYVGKLTEEDLTAILEACRESDLFRPSDKRKFFY